MRRDSSPGSSYRWPMELSRETRERGKAEVAALRAKLRGKTPDATLVFTVADDEVEDSEPVDTWSERRDLQ